MLKIFLKKFILKYKFRLSPKNIIIGAEGSGQKGWIPTEQVVLNLLRSNDWKFLFPENSITAILAEHVWEHLHIEEARFAAGICYKFLKPGGYLRVAVPDGLHPDPNYIESVRPGGSGAGCDDHKMLYTYKSFSNVFQSAGFRVHLLEHFDEQGKFHFMDWLPIQGMIHRSSKFDRRNSGDKLNYTSIILDAVK